MPSLNHSEPGASSRDRLLFWCLLAVQAAGSQAIIWEGVPIYRRLQSPGGNGATIAEFAVVIAVIVVMQLAHWPALRLKQRLRFRRNPLLGHILVWIGEISLFFTAAISTLIVFDRLTEQGVNIWKALVLAALIFTVGSYKYQILSLGVEMIEAPPEPTDHGEGP